MKKILFSVILIIGFYTAGASNLYMKNNEAGGNNTCLMKEGNKGNISSEELPASIKKYLNDTYNTYSYVVCKRKGNGFYFVKIKYKGSQYRYYYRSLVFDSQGNVVKG